MAQATTSMVDATGRKLDTEPSCEAPITPPYDTPKNRARYNVETKGALTTVSHKFNPTEVMQTLKRLSSFKINRARLAQIWKFFLITYSISPARFTLQLLGKILESLIAMATEYYTSRFKAQLSATIWSRKLDHRKLVLNCALAAFMPLLGLLVSNQMERNQVILRSKFKTMIQTQILEAKCRLDLHSQEKKVLLNGVFRELLVLQHESEEVLSNGVKVLGGCGSMLTKITILLKYMMSRQSGVLVFVSLACVWNINYLQAWWINKKEAITLPEMNKMAVLFDNVHQRPYIRHELKLLGLTTTFTEKFKKLSDSLGFITDESQEGNVFSATLEACATSLAQGFYIWKARDPIARGLLPEVAEVDFLRNAAQGIIYEGLHLHTSLLVLRSRIKGITAFFDVKEITPQVQEPDHPVAYASTQTSSEPEGMGIEFSDVSFRYPDTERMVLKHINLKIKPGQLVALVGDNGAGKSTLINVLTRLYDVTEGEILVNGVPIKNFNTRDLQAQMAILFQSTGRLECTIKNFISLYAPSPQMELVEAAAKQAGCHNFILKTYAGYESYIGYEQPPAEAKDLEECLLLKCMHWDYTEETGKDNEDWYTYDTPLYQVNLSGGQWQRIALARAFYIKNAGLRVYDEFSKELDSIAERDAFRQIWKTREQTKATILYVTHKYTSVPWADLILCMKDGELIESGTHTELLALKGHYFKLYDTAASGLSKEGSYIWR